MAFADACLLVLASSFLALAVLELLPEKRAQKRPRIRRKLSLPLGQKKQKAKEKEALLAQLPLALQSLSFALSAGYSVPQAFKQAGEAVPEPLHSQILAVCWDFDAGCSIEESLRHLMEHTDLKELRLLLVAFAVQHRTGGQLKGILENCQQSLRSQAELRRELQVQTAQARLSAKIVTILPLALFALVSLLSPTYMAAFWSSPLGFLLLLLALALDGLGVLIIRRILDLKQG